MARIGLPLGAEHHSTDSQMHRAHLQILRLEFNFRQFKNTS